MDMNAATEWHIRVKALLEGGEEKEFQIATLANDTVGQFRNKLATRSHIEPQKQRLIFCGRLLNDNAQKLADTGMRDGSALHMVARAVPPAPSGTTPDADSTGAGRDSQNNTRNMGGGMGGMGFGFPGLQTFFQSMFNNMNAPQTGGGPSPQQQQQAGGERVIREIHRNFGANDGGEWIALDQNNRYFLIDREAEPGSLLTLEEFQRGPIETSNPISRSSESSSYDPLPGLVRMEPAQSTSESSQSQSYRDTRMSRLLDQARTAPSQALVNELTHDLFDYVMPAIRRLPGDNDFRFSTTDSLRPTYLERTSDNPVGAAGASLANLGDAYIALGNALQSIGRRWQADRGSEQSQHDEGALEQQSRNALRVLAELSLTGPLAVPLLQSNLSDTASQSQQEPTTDDARDGNENLNGQNMVSENQVRILTSRARRNHRYHAFEQMIDAGSEPAGSSGAATVELHISPIGPSAGFPPQIMQAMRMMQQHGQNEQQQQQQQQTQAQEQAQTQQQEPHANLDALQHMFQQNSGSDRNETNAGSRGENFGNNTANTSRIPRSVRFMPNAHAVELVIERIGPFGAGSHPNSASRVQSRDQSSVSQQQQQESSLPHGSNQPSQTTSRVPTEQAGAADHSVALGSQSARSDRSIGSTTTEYSNSNNPFMHVPRIFGASPASILSPPQQQQYPQPVDTILQQQLARATNPFSTAMIFLGAEPGSTTSNTSRRASVSSSTNGTQNIGDAVANTSEHADATTNQPAPTNSNTTDAACAEPSLSAGPVAPRTGETRGRTSSTSESDVNTGGCDSRGASGSSKRHRACDGAEDS
ncbi:hypothetical protein COEREDRAFT_81205 [Coemansia reversa NRRL 1564]|uniref:Ubiquitin-like domain-containing protein n=1 Tax=Coemansia reversa (strain ATCC 12441 / NRRL 1564) TaxID=763665 RepID=A0A2G5BBZ4_COERN|nr:hypothetical protein COEREDRAFT_81205 [Coemansia reversa NRRL 1564]|eukprot:PIA16538.1 hypothetical protein COEREDRAFT_81205 [Coemansia reversa NRRL 1564]